MMSPYGSRGEYENMTEVGHGSMQEITPQSVVHVNFAVNPNMSADRKAALAYLDRDQFDILGGPTMEDRKLSIVMGEVLWTDVSQHRYAKRAKTAFQVNVFTAFNGIPFPKNQSQDNFRKRFRPVGFARAHFDASQQVPSFSGVSGQVSGSLSIHNNGTHRFFYGDVIGAALPSIENDTIRNRQYAAAKDVMPTGPGSFAGKLTSLVEKVTYKRVMDEFGLVAMNLVAKHGSLSVTDYHARVDSHQLDAISHRDIMSTLLKQQLAVNFLTGMHVMQNLGYQSPSIGWAVDLSDRGDAEKWKKARAPLAKAINSTSGNNIAARAKGYAWVPLSEEEFGQVRLADDYPAAVAIMSKAVGVFKELDDTEKVARKKAYNNHVTFMATRLGLIDTTAAGKVGNNSGGEDTAIALHGALGALHGSLPHNVRRDPTVRTYIDDSLGLQPFTATAIGNYDFVDLVDASSQELRRALDEAAPLYAKVHGEMYNLISRYVVAVSTSIAQPNQMVHAVAVC